MMEGRRKVTEQSLKEMEHGRYNPRGDYRGANYLARHKCKEGWAVRGEVRNGYVYEVCTKCHEDLTSHWLRSTRHG